MSTESGCRPWCRDGDCTPADICSSEPTYIELSLAERRELYGTDETEPDFFRVYAEQSGPQGIRQIALGHGDDPEKYLSAAEALQLAAALVAQATLLDGTRA